MPAQNIRSFSAKWVCKMKIKTLLIGAALALGIGSAAFATQVVQDNLAILGTLQTGVHVGNASVPGELPAVTGTGSPTIAAGSTDHAGIVTAGSSATSVVITFATPYAAAPECNVDNQSQVTSFAYAVSTTAITITQTSTSGNIIDYDCTALAGGL